MNIEKLSQVVTFLPKSKIKASEAKKNGKYVFFTSSDTKRSYIDKFLYDDELIVLGTGGFASCNYYNGKFAVSTDNFVIKPKNNLLPKYLYYYLRKDNLLILNNGFRGIGIKHISKDYVMNISIPMATLDNQKSIINNLDNIIETIEREKQCIIHCDELIKSRFNKLFGDPLLNEYGFEIKELSKLAPFNSVKNAIVVNNNTWLLNLDMIESDTGRIVEKIRTSEIGDSTIEFDTTCVLYSKLRPYLNKVVIPDENGIGTSELISMRCDSKIITREYLAYSLRHKSFVNYINSKTGGAKMPRTNMNDLRSFKMPIPPMELQEGFSSFVNQIDKLKFNCQQRIKLYQELLDKKMDEYFG